VLQESSIIFFWNSEWKKLPILLGKRFVIIDEGVLEVVISSLNTGIPVTASGCHSLEMFLKRCN
jgi:hypothetical protein